MPKYSQHVLSVSQHVLQVSSGFCLFLSIIFRFLSVSQHHLQVSVCFSASSSCPSSPQCLSLWSPLCLRVCAAICHSAVSQPVSLPHTRSCYSKVFAIMLIIYSLQQGICYSRCCHCICIIRYSKVFPYCVTCGPVTFLERVLCHWQLFV